MKNILIFFGCLIVPALLAQKPEKIYPGARDHKSIAWLKEQSTAWKKEVDKDPKNREAWYNYYYANRNLSFSDTTDKRPGKERNAEILKLVENMGENIAESYEYNIVKWM